LEALATWSPSPLDRAVVLDDAALGVLVRAAGDLDGPPLAQRRDHGLPDQGHAVPVRALDLRAVPDVPHRFLDLAQLAPAHGLGPAAVDMQPYGCLI
jgi:hypothetical protein